MNETKRLNDIIKKQGEVNNLVEITNELLDLFPEWTDKQPLCVNGYEITHRHYNKNYAIDPEYKYLCFDARDCGYKKILKDRQYCQLHLDEHSK